MKIKALVVDDSLYMRTFIAKTLKDAGIDVIAEAANGETAIDLALAHAPDLITLDNILPDMLGLDVLRTLKDEKLASKVIMISGVGQETVVEEGKGLGADEYLVKPLSPEQLTDAIRRIFN